MSELFKPGPKTEQVIVAPYRVERHEAKEEEAQLAELNARFKHDPFWRTRFWSVQHVRDVVDGKAHHWFWSPIKGLAESALVAFTIMPVIAVLSKAGYRFNLISLLAIYFGTTLALQAISALLHALYWWRFNHIRRKLKVIHRT